MATLGKYLYAIVRGSGERIFPDAPSIGETGGPVHAVPFDGLAAVVSDSLVTKYESTRANLLAHQRVQERVMRECTLLPVRFGTVAEAAEPVAEVRRLLERRGQEFYRLLAEVEGKEELGLKALWRDEKAVFEEVVAENEAIRRLRDSLRGRPPAATHYDRMRLGEMVKGALDQKRAAEGASLLAPLRRIASRTVENPILLDRMVLNAAFLVEKEQEQEFDQALGRLAEEKGHRVAFKYVGPVPPYNFVNITIDWREV